MEFSLDIVIYLLGLASMWGSSMSRIKTLEKKMDLHNSAMIRIAELEKGMDGYCKQTEIELKNIHYRLNELKGEQK